MFSNELKNEMKTKFTLSDSIINSSKHYQIPKFVFKSKFEYSNNKYNITKYTNRVVSLRNYLIDKSKELNNLSKTQYCEKKRENVNNILKKIQSDKVDFLINRAYNKINDNIRKYNKKISLPRNQPEIKLGFLPLVQRQTIIDHVMNKTQKYLPLINPKFDFLRYGMNKKCNKEEKKSRQMIWSHKFLQQKKLEEYEKIYRIKYLATEQSNNIGKFKDELTQKDYDNPQIERYIVPISNPKYRTHSSNKKIPTMNISLTTSNENIAFKSKK